MKLALFFLCLSSAFAQHILLPIVNGNSSGGGGATPVTCTPLSGYSHCRQLTVDHTQIPSTLTNFPVVAWSGFTLGAGRIQNASCFDVIFTSDSVGATKIPWEVESCDQSTGAMVVHFLDASASSTTDGNFFVHYQNAAITTAQNTGANAPTAVWDSNYSVVYHLSDNAANTNVTDSTTNNPGTAGANTSLSSIAAQLGRGLDAYGWTGSAGTPAYAAVGTPNTATMPTATGDYTWSAWYQNVDNSSSTSANRQVFQWGGNATEDAVAVYQPGATANLFISHQAGADDRDTGYMPPTNQWIFLTGTYSGGVDKLYVNGTLVFTSSAVTVTMDVANYLIVAQTPNRNFGITTAPNYVDEFRLSKTLRAANWITAEYNNQKASSSFLTVGVEQPPGLTLISHTGAGNGGSATTATSTAISTVGANFIVVNCPNYSGGTGITAPTDSASNTWNAFTVRNSSLVFEEAFWVANPTTSGTHTFTCAGGSSDFPSIQVAAFSGVNTVSTLESENGHTDFAMSSATIQPGSLTPAANNELVLAFFAFGYGSYMNCTTMCVFTSVSSPFVTTDSVNGTGVSQIGGAIAYSIQTTATAANPTFTINAVGPDLAAALAVIK